MQNTEDKLKKINQEIKTNNIKIYFAFKFLRASLQAGINELINYNHYLEV